MRDHEKWKSEGASPKFQGAFCFVRIAFCLHPTTHCTLHHQPKHLQTALRMSSSSNAAPTADVDSKAPWNPLATPETSATLKRVLANTKVDTSLYVAIRGGGGSDYADACGDA